MNQQSFLLPHYSGCKWHDNFMAENYIFPIDDHKTNLLPTIYGVVPAFINILIGFITLQELYIDNTPKIPPYAKH